MFRKPLIVRSLIFLLLIAPIVIYLWTFGWKLSSEHSRWGEFGSAMSGIYTPILTLLTLSVLVFQARLQQQMHEHDQTKAYIDQARTDIEFYVIRLELVFFQKISTGNTVREILHSQFQPKNIDALDSPMLRKLSHQINREEPQLLAIYQAVQAVLVGLSSSQETPYQLNYTSAVQKLIALLSFETCVALENYCRTVTEGRIKGTYVFSPLLRT